MAIQLIPLCAASTGNTLPAPAAHTAATQRTDAELAARVHAFLEAATSRNTRLAYGAAIRHYQTWGGLLPASENDILRYLATFADTLNPRTLALRLTALSQWHVFQQFPNPTDTATVRKVMVGIGRVNGRPKKKARALPVEDLERIVAALAGLGTLKAARDNALLQVGFFGGFRRSELVAIEVDHLTWDDRGMTIMLPRSKTDQSGEGVVKAIPYGAGLLCPATAIKAWLVAADLASGPVFRSISKWGEVGSAGLSPASVNTILAGAAQLASLGYVPELSSHSLRRGMATSAHRVGVNILNIKRQGNWRHDSTVQGYIDEAGIYDGNAAGGIIASRVKPAIDQ